jgi:hypothetical protein
MFNPLLFLFTFTLRDPFARPLFSPPHLQARVSTTVRQRAVLRPALCNPPPESSPRRRGSDWFAVSFSLIPTFFFFFFFGIFSIFRTHPQLTHGAGGDYNNNNDNDEYERSVSVYPDTVSAELEPILGPAHQALCRAARVPRRRSSSKHVEFAASR